MVTGISIAVLGIDTESQARGQKFLVTLQEGGARKDGYRMEVSFPEKTGELDL